MQDRIIITFKMKLLKKIGRVTHDPAYHHLEIIGWLLQNLLSSQSCQTDQATTQQKHGNRLEAGLEIRIRIIIIERSKRFSNDTTAYILGSVRRSFEMK